jgi:hypothetical protein
MPNTLTSNQHYQGLNNRFDKRAARLLSLGFRYQQVDGMNMAVFARRTSRLSTATIPAAVLSHADNRSWFDTLQRKLR